jgi:hypothetical protein
MSELAHTHSTAIATTAMPPGARAVGVRVKPALRLAIGYRDPQKRGAPTKVDYFIPKEGAEGEFARAAAKFREVYGEKPKAVEIRLPGEFGDALDIRYKAFAGASGDEGGVMVAKGDTNFALYDYVGGPDTLTIWRQDGTVEEVASAGLDALTGEPLDEVARDLQLGLYTTFRFGIPNVLGYGSHCEITSKGKATTDTLWFKLRGFYGTFGYRTSFVVRPTLVVKPASARPVVKRGDQTQRIKTRIYVLDIVPTETEDEMLERFREHAALTAQASETLYGSPLEAPPARMLEPTAAPIRIEGPEGSAVQPPSARASGDEQADQGQEAAEAASAPPAPPLAAVEEPPPLLEEIEAEDALALSEDEQARLPEVMRTKIPMGSYQGMPLSKLLAYGASAREWVGYGLSRAWPEDPGFHDALVVFAKAHAPDIYRAWLEGDV